MTTKNFFTIKATSFNSNLLNLFYCFIQNLLKKYNIQRNTIYLKNKIKKFTLLKSPHVHKKAREQFQLIKYSFLVSFHIPQSKSIDFFFFLKLNTPKMIDTRVTLKKQQLLNSCFIKNNKPCK